MAQTDRNSNAAYIAWYSTTHLHQEPYCSNIDYRWQSFNSCFASGSTGSRVRLGRLINPTVSHLITINDLIDRWPIPIRCTLSQSSLPLAKWAQPQFLERRMQAVAVWYGMVNFLAFVLRCGENQSALREIGFDPEVYDLLDDLRLYVSIQDQFRPRPAAVVQKVEELLLCAIRDPSPSVRTNPLLWWMGVLVHCDLVRRHDRAPIQMQGSRDTLDFAMKLEALEHFSRVLVFSEALRSWVRDDNSISAAAKQELGDWVNSTDVSWVDEGLDEPRAEISAGLDLASPAWEAWHAAFRKDTEKWLMWNSDGPMREILALRIHAMPLARWTEPQVRTSTTAAGSGYRVKYLVLYDWRRNPGSLKPEPSTHSKAFRRLEVANEATHDIVHAQLRLAIDATDEDRDEVKRLEDLAGMFEDEKTTESGEWFEEGFEGMREAFNENWSEDRDGMMRRRLLFCDADDECVKVTAWVEKVEEE